MPVMFLDGLQRKMSCGPCIRGHRSSKCNHDNRLLVEVRQPGRPLAKCPHKTHPCSCDRLVVVNYAIPLANSCPCKARSFLKMRPTRSHTRKPPPPITHTPDCLHNPANIEILSDVVVVNKPPEGDSTSLTSPFPNNQPSSNPVRSQCCSNANINLQSGNGGETEQEPRDFTLSCCSSKPPAPETPPLRLLDAIQISELTGPQLVAYYIHNGDTKLCSRVEAQKTSQGYLTTEKPQFDGGRVFSGIPPRSVPNPMENTAYSVQSMAAVPAQVHSLQHQSSAPLASTFSTHDASAGMSFPSQASAFSTDGINGVWAEHGMDPMATGRTFPNATNLCMCGERCSCVGCPEHLHNDATMEYVLYHVAASADLTSPPAMDMKMYDGNVGQAGPIPQEWTAYEDAFDFMSHGTTDLNGQGLGLGTSDNYVVPWLPTASEPSNLMIPESTLGLVQPTPPLPSSCCHTPAGPQSSLDPISQSHVSSMSSFAPQYSTEATFLPLVTGLDPTMYPTNSHSSYLNTTPPNQMVESITPGNHTASLTGNWYSPLSQTLTHALSHPLPQTVPNLSTQSLPTSLPHSMTHLVQPHAPAQPLPHSTSSQQLQHHHHHHHHHHHSHNHNHHSSQSFSLHQHAHEQQNGIQTISHAHTYPLVYSHVMNSGADTADSLPPSSTVTTPLDSSAVPYESPGLGAGSFSGHGTEVHGSVGGDGGGGGGNKAVDSDGADGKGAVPDGGYGGDGKGDNCGASGGSGGSSEESCENQGLSF